MKTRDLARLALVLAPTFAITAWIGSIVWSRAHQPVRTIAIVGYDPRDLLRGHYLQFRLSLAADGTAPCACLEDNPGDTARPLVKPMACEVGPPPPLSCPHYIKGPLGGFRHYMSEGAALAAQEALRGRDDPAKPPKATIQVFFHGDGTVSFDHLEIR